MERLSNSEIIEMVKEITIAKLNNSESKMSTDGIPSFMQVVYNKLRELNDTDD